MRCDFQTLKQEIVFRFLGLKGYSNLFRLKIRNVCRTRTKEVIKRHTVVELITLKPYQPFGIPFVPGSGKQNYVLRRVCLRIYRPVLVNSQQHVFILIDILP